MSEQQVVDDRDGRRATEVIRHRDEKASSIFVVHDSSIQPDPIRPAYLHRTILFRADIWGVSKTELSPQNSFAARIRKEKKTKFNSRTELRVHATELRITTHDVEVAYTDVQTRKVDSDDDSHVLLLPGGPVRIRLITRRRKID